MRAQGIVLCARFVFLNAVGHRVLLKKYRTKSCDISVIAYIRGS